MDKIHYSSKTPEWETPQWFYDKLNIEFGFGFTLDPCATKKNAKCDKYYTKEQDGLKQDWAGHNVFMNPPYGREIGKWVKKAYETSQVNPYPIVCLLPSRTDTKWWHDYCMEASEIRFIKGRLKFGGCKNSAPFPSVIVIFRHVLSDSSFNVSVPVCCSF